ncbi:MAG: PAS domain S-box protein [Methanoregula sp.]|nr:PAS domain S-box protein [Methanoregula sp.]
MIKQADPNMQFPPSFEVSAFLASPPEADAVPCSDKHASCDKSILIVEDEAVVANDIRETLKSLGYDVAGIAKSGEDALEKVKELRPDLVLMDIHLATAMDGIEAAGKIHILYDIPVIYLTAFADKTLIDRAKVTEPYGYIIKPYDERELKSTIEIAFYKHKHDLQIREANVELEQRVAERTVELEQINRALSESERRYRNLFEGVPIGIYRTTPSGQILDINPALVSLLGYPNREMLMKVDVSDIYMDPGDRNRWLDLIEREGIVREFEVQFRKYDGTIIRVQDTGKAVYDDKGQVGHYYGNVEDITERLRAEETLRETNEYLHKLIDFANAPIIVWDPDFQITRFNHAFERLTGRAEQEVIGQPLDILFPKKSRDTSLALIKKTLTGERLETVEIPILASDETIHTVLCNTANILTDDAELISTIAQGIDITERKQVEGALRTSEEKYRQLVDLAQEGIWAIDAEGKTTYVNPKMAEMLGYTVEEMQGAHLFSFMDDAGKAIAADNMERRRQGITEDHEFEFITKGGNRIYAVLATAPITDDKGVHTGALAVVSDITGHKAADAALWASEQRYRDVVEDQTEFICRFLPDGRLTFINDAYCNYFTLNREECIGKTQPVLLPPYDAQQMKNHLAALTPENPIALISHRIVMPSGEVRWHRWSDRAIYDKKDEVIEYQSVGRDITSQKETETQLENYKETLEQRVRDRTSELSRTNLKLKKEIEDRKIIQKKLTLSSNEKELLLREVHHRVKNNLQLIIGLIDMTKTRAHEPAVLSTLTDIMAKVQTMGSIHTRLYESKRFDKINMKRQVHDIVEMISGFHDHDHLDIMTNIDCVEIYLPVDQAIPSALALNEIISNIHKHAFKGRRIGLVEISLSVKGDQLRFVVRDNGVGLPTGFDIEKSNRLGLKLMRTLVEQQLHGSVQITSKAGTEVVIEFPIIKGETDYGTGTGS